MSAATSESFSGTTVMDKEENILGNSASPASEATTPGRGAGAETDSPTSPTQLTTSPSAPEVASEELDKGQLTTLVKGLLCKENVCSDPTIAFLVTRDVESLEKDACDTAKDTDTKSGSTTFSNRCGIYVADLLRHQAILAFGRVTEEDIISAIKSVGVNFVEYDADRKRAYPVLKAARNTIILRDLMSANESDIQNILCESKTLLAQTTSEIKDSEEPDGPPPDWSNIKSKVIEIRKELGGNWFVTLESEELAQKVAFDLMGKVYQERPIRVGVKSQTQYVPLQELGYPMNLNYRPGLYPGYRPQDYYQQGGKYDRRGGQNQRPTARSSQFRSGNVRKGMNNNGRGRNENRDNQSPNVPGQAQDQSQAPSLRGQGNKTPGKGKPRGNADRRPISTARKVLAKNPEKPYEILSTDFPPLGDRKIVRYTHEELVSLNITAKNTASARPGGKASTPKDDQVVVSSEVESLPGQKSLSGSPEQDESCSPADEKEIVTPPDAGKVEVNSTMASSA